MYANALQGGADKKCAEGGNLCPPRPKAEAVLVTARLARSDKKSYSTVLLALQDTDTGTEQRYEAGKVGQEELLHRPPRPSGHGHWDRAQVGGWRGQIGRATPPSSWPFRTRTLGQSKGKRLARSDMKSYSTVLLALQDTDTGTEQRYEAGEDRQEKLLQPPLWPRGQRHRDKAQVCRV